MTNNHKIELYNEVSQIYSEVQKRILLIAEASLPRENFIPFRKAVLDMFGYSFALARLKEIIDNYKRNNTP